MKTTLLSSLTGVILLAGATLFNAPDSGSEWNQITSVLNDYIEGTANGEPDRVRNAFHPDFNLYTVTPSDSLWIRSGKKYIEGITPGKKNSRQGRIVSIDVEGNAAMAKAEIVIPGWRIFTDYFLLLKYQGEWKIVQKSYSWREIPSKKD